MPQYLHLPDGSGIALKPGEDPKEVWNRAQQLYPDAFGITPKQETAPVDTAQSGFVPAFKSSASQLKADLANLAGKTGIIAPERAEQIGKEEAEYQKKTFKPTEKGWTEDFGTKFGELLGGSAPYTIAPLAAGLGALALPEAAAAAPFVGGALEGLGLGTVGEATAAGLAGAASTAQFTGSNLSRQMEEGKSLADTNLGSAFGAAIPQAALDVFGLRMIPGIRNIFAEAGHKISDAEARAIASQGLKKTLGDYALNTGKVAGAEGLTEAGQQVLERLQAGLSLTDPDAQKEYFDNFLGGAVLGGTLGVPGRFVERGQAKSQAAAADRADKAKQLADQQAAEAQQAKDLEAFKQTPEYITDLSKRWEAFNGPYQDLLAKSKVKVESGDLVGAADKKEAKAALSDLLKDPDNQDLINEYRAVQAKVKAEKERQDREKAAAEKQAAYEKAMQQPGAQGELFAGTPDQDLIEAARAQETPTPAETPTAQEFNDLQAHIGRRMYLARQNAAEAADENEIAKHANDHAALTQAQANLEKLRPQVAQAEPNAHLISPLDLNFEDTELELKRQRTKLEKAQQLGDMDAIKKASDRIQELKKRPSLFGEDNTRPALEAAQDAERLKFTEEIERLRKEAIERRQKLGLDYGPIIKRYSPVKGATYGQTVVDFGNHLENEVSRLQKIVDANKQPGLFANALEQRKADIAKKELDDAKTLLAQFRQQPTKTATGKIVMPPKITQDWQSLKEEPKYAQEDFEKEPSNYELLDQRVEELLNQHLPTALGEKPVAKNKPNVERRVQSDGGIQTVVTQDNGTISQNVTRYTYNVKTADEEEPQQIRIERNNITGETEGFFVVGGRPIGSGIGIKNLIANGVSHTQAIKRAIPDITSVNRTEAEKEAPDLLGQNQPTEKISGENISPGKTTKERRKKFEKIRNFSYRIKELKGRIRTMHAEMMRGIEHPEYPSLIKEYQYLQGRLEELQNVSKRVQGPGRYLPIVEAQNLLDSIDTNEKILDDLNALIQKAGKPTNPAKVAELTMLQERRAYIQQEIEDARSKYNTMAEREQRPVEEAPKEQPDLFGLSGAYGKSAAEVKRIQDNLDRLYKEREDIKEGMRRRSQEANTPQLQALLDKYSKEPTGRYQQIGKQIEQLEQEHRNATGKTSEKFQAFADEREAEKQPTVRTEEQKMLPGFGLKQYTELKKPVPKETLDAARTKQIELQTQLEKIRAAASTPSKEEIERTKTLNYLISKRKSGFSGDIAYNKVFHSRNVETKIEQDIKAARDAREKNLVKQEEKIRDQIEKAKAKVAELESRQRMYEEQQDAINRVVPGTRAAQQLIAGKGYRTVAYISGKDYRNVSEQARKGQARTAPKQASSWGIPNAVRVKTEKPSELAKATAVVNKANDLVTTAKEETTQAYEEQGPKLVAAKKRLQSLNDAVGKLFLELQPSQRKELKEAKERLELAQAEVEVSNAFIRDPKIVAERTAELHAAEKMLADLVAKPVLGPPEELSKYRHSIFIVTDTIRKLRNQLPNENAATELKAAQEHFNSVSKRVSVAPEQNNVDVLNEAFALQDFINTHLPQQDFNNANAILERFETPVDPQEAGRLASQMLANISNMDAQVAAIAKKLDAFKAEYEEMLKSGYSPAVLESHVQDLINKAASADKAHTAALVKYAIARRDFLAFQYASSQKIQAAYKEAVAARDAEQVAQQNDPELKAAADAIEKANAVQTEAQKRLSAALEKQKEAEDKLKGKQLVKEAKQEEALKKAKAPYEGVPKDVAQRAREGLGLEGTRVELDTTGVLAQAVQNNAKKMLGMAQTQLKDAIDRGDAKAVNKHTLEVKRYERELQEVLPVAEKKVTKITEEKEPSEQAEVEPGERLPNRREGPVVRTAARAPSAMLSGTAESRTPIGKGNRPKQAGVIKLRASDLSPEKANAVSLHVTKEKLDAAEDGTKRKETLQKQYDNAVAGLTPEQVQGRLEEGARIMKEGGSMELIAARERLREAHLEVTRSEKTLENAKTKAEKELARDDLERAIEKEDRAEERYKNVKAETYAKKVTETAEDAVESDIEFTENASPFNRLNKAIEDADDDFFAAAAREAPGTVLPDEAIKSLIDRSLIGALEHIADSDKGFLGQHADAVRQFLMRTKVEIVPEIIHKGKSVPALYDPTTNTAYFTPQGFTVEDVVHEATHAATMRVLTMPEKELTPAQRTARREIEAMFRNLETDPKFKGQYGMENIKEFVSEVMANKDLRDMMDNRPWYRGNMLERFFKAVLDFFRKTPLSENMLPRAEELIRSIFMQSRNIEAEKVGAAPAYKSALVGSAPGKWENFKGNFFGLGGRVQLVDKLAAVDSAVVAAEGAGKMTSLEAFQTQYFMRMGDQVSTAAGQFILHGPMKVVVENTPQGKEYRYESQDGANLVDVSEHLGNMSKALGVSNEEAERMATVLIAGERANALTNGWSRLNADNPAGVKAEFDADTRAINRNAEAKTHFMALRKAYKEYNDGQLDFAVQCDFMSKDEADRLKRLPYIPFYRIQDGKVQLFTAGEKAITIGNIKDNPDLKAMVGDNTHILPLMTSAVQNTFMLTRMALHNKATLETANGLNKAGFVSRMGTGPGLANADTVHYKIGGKDAFATIDSDTFGIPAHLIVKGMEGIKTTIPALVKAMGIPSQWVRKFVTRFPAYGVRQLLRDPVNSFILSGTDGVPMVNALKELSKMYTGQSQAEQDLMRGLAVSSNIFSGDEKDMTKFLQDIATGKSSWQKMLGHLDKFALQADTATRATIYNDGLKKGLTKAQAQFRAFESQNLSRRGLSPSMQMLNTLIPFFNSQVQGLDVLYRSLTNQMPFAEQMEIRRKLVARSMMLMGVSMAYALMMQDDDDYRKARPEERYNNFFIHLPFVKDPLKIPIPYEVGILFKALPEAIIDSAHKDMTATEAAKGMGKLVWQNAVPSLIPAAPKPFLEAYYGETATGPIETEREKKLMATERYRANTTEAAKMVGQLTGQAGVSPIMLEHFIRGYTGSMGLAALHMIDPVLASSAEGEKASMAASDVPFIGGLFQREGRYLIERAYERMDDVEKAQATYKDKLKKGQRAEAESFRQNYANLIAAGQAAGSFQKNMGTLFSRERAILANPQLSQADKDARIEEIRKQENAYAQRFTEVVDKRVRQ